MSVQDTYPIRPTMSAHSSSGSSETTVETQASSFPSIIPPTHPARTLVLCFDGTGDQFDADNSNVVRFFSMLKKGNRREQMVYYQAGIGTYLAPQVATPFTTQISKTLDEMIAWNLDSHVMGGYEFLMQNYEEGDKICIFGFSRGAYTARALAGMIHKVGLLPACNHQQVPFAYKMYTDTTKEGWDMSRAFKKAFSVNVLIDFIGVWDTVASVGLVPKRLPFTAGNTAVRVFRHAVSLDERRAKFKANLFHRGEDGEGTGVNVPGRLASRRRAEDALMLRERYGLSTAETGEAGNVDRSSPTHIESDEEMEQRFSYINADGDLSETDVLEVWFAGSHCDVGGGSVPNGTRHTLARIPLRWMIRQCFLAGIGILFETETLWEAGLDPRSLWPVVKERPSAVYSMRESEEARTISIGVGHGRSLTNNKVHTSNAKHGHPETKRTRSLFCGSNVHKQVSTNGSMAILDGLPPTPISPVFSGLGRKMHAEPAELLTEEEEDYLDALSPMYDQLSLRLGWWILEMLPMRHRVQRPDDSWAWETFMNLGKGRAVPHEGKHNEQFFVHRSVKIRMEAEELVGGAYTPKAKYELQPTWVD